MAGNAHRNRARRFGCPKGEHCIFCKLRPSKARAQGVPYKNSNGHRRNPARKRRQRRKKGQHKVQV